ncbi:MAG: protealysin inhibitor emfourin [Nostocoides sp.]
MGANTGSHAATGVCHIVPPYILQALANDPDRTVAARARASLVVDDQVRIERRAQPSARPGRPTVVPDAASGPHRVISDAQGRTTTPGRAARTEGDPATGDPATDEAYAGLGDTWTLWHQAYGRDSLDGAGLALLGTVHYGKDYDNAFWDGTQMVFGDGDGVIFNRFTISVDVIGHELAHGVTSYTADLTYRGQSGALNESMSDVFGSLVKQLAREHDAADADWLIGEGLLTSQVNGRGLRDMLHPGTAYDDPRLGKDPQPEHMSGYVVTASDNGGVHINSGIPNRAFALAATSVGGPAWTLAGQVWWDVLSGAEITPACDFATFAKLTVAAAAARFGSGSDIEQAVASAWQSVGVLTATRRKSVRATRAARATAAALAAPSAGPSGETSVLVRRTGGVAGVQTQRQVTLGELPERDRQAWTTLLTAQTLVESPATSDRPDAFCYQVSSPQLGLDTLVAEPHLPSRVRHLLEKTLRH